MTKGIVKWFNGKKGFGFIEAEGTGVDVFVHVSELVGEGPRTFTEGDRVEFETARLQNGLQAKKVRKLNLTPAAE